MQAAVEAAEAGKRVILVEQDNILGASLIRDPQELDAAWIAATAARIRAAGGRILTRTTASGYWEHDLVTLTQRLSEPGQVPANGVAQRLWHVRARQVILANGSIERPMAFAHNDRPGVMLSQALRSYVRRFGVVPGKRLVIATNNDDAYRTALALAEAGSSIAAILDSRPADGVHSALVQKAMAQLPVHFGAKLIAAKGSAKGLKGASALIEGKVTALDCDLIAVSGGFSPVTHS